MLQPSYLRLHESNQLQQRALRLRELASPCTLCPHLCRSDRAAGKTGVCASPLAARVSSAFAHYGEERPLVGAAGSGTIFFCGCNLRCCFCQNWEISHNYEEGRKLDADQLAALMLNLQRQGCHNVNFVTPTHFVHAIVEAVAIAAGAGLSLPLVYNCGGYERVETLELLEGVIDVYMPDVKFYDDGTASRFLEAKDYGSRAREALREMHRQVGDLQLSPVGTAARGMLIRHLVLPSGLAGTADWARWIAENLSPDSYVNIMGQYRPCFQADRDPEIAR
ncbi:MAG: radical SAM protein, partial [Candidatus Glassbacteria bacterium]